MKMNISKISFIFCSSLLLFITNVNYTYAQWALPANVFGLTDDFMGSVLRISNWLLAFTVTLSVLAIIWGGLNYISSSGDTQKADLSKKIIYYATIGIIVSGVSYALVSLIATKLLA